MIIEFKVFLAKTYPFRKFFIWKKQRQYAIKGLLDYRYVKEKYKDTFLENVVSMSYNPQLVKATQQIFSFWTGTNPMSENRKRGFDSLNKKSKTDVILITPRNLANYILSEYPLHPAFDYLSLVHKADYLRCYFMHHHGGGYADIKEYNYSWKKAFQKLNKSDKYGIGYQEISELTVAHCNELVIFEDLKNYFPLLLGNGAYIFKPNSSFTHEWYNELNRRLDLYYSDLESYDQKNIAYPIPYTFLLGDIFHPLCLKYHDKLLKDENLKPNFHNYK